MTDEKMKSALAIQSDMPFAKKFNGFYKGEDVKKKKKCCCVYNLGKEDFTSRDVENVKVSFSL